MQLVMRKDLPTRARVQAHRLFSVLALHERVPRVMDHLLPRCLPAEKFPTFASGRLRRGAVTLSGLYPPFPRAMQRHVFPEESLAYGMDPRDQFIGLACDNRASAQLFSGFGIPPSVPYTGESEGPSIFHGDREMAARVLRRFV